MTERYNAQNPKFQDRLGKLEAEHSERFPDGIPEYPDDGPREKVPFWKLRPVRTLAARVFLILLGMIPYTVNKLFVSSVALGVSIEQLFEANSLRIFVVFSVVFVAFGLLAVQPSKDARNNVWPEGFGVLIWVVIGVVISNFTSHYLLVSAV